MSEGAVSDQQHWLSRALIDAALGTTDELNEYIVQYLSGHVADGNAWRELAEATSVLDRLDPVSVAADALRSLHGRELMPPAIAGVTSAALDLVEAERADRQGIRQIATARVGAQLAFVEKIAEGSTWSLTAANIRSVTVHAVLAGHRGYVNSLCALPWDDGRHLLASAGDDRLVRLWDPVRMSAVGVPLAGHSGTVEGVCSFVSEDGKSLLASSGGDSTIRIWDPRTSRPIGRPLSGHVGTAWDVCAVLPTDVRNRPLIVSCGADGTVRCWDPLRGGAVGEPMRGHASSVVGLCVVPELWDSAVVASAGSDGTVRFWDAEQCVSIGPVIKAHDGPAVKVAFIRLPRSTPLVASSGGDGVVRVWDPLAGHQVGDDLRGHAGLVEALCILSQPGGEYRIASGGGEGSIRLWDPAVSLGIGNPMTGHTGPVADLCALEGVGNVSLLASAGSDGTVRLWGTGVQSSAASVANRMARQLRTVCTVRVKNRIVVAAGGTDGSIYMLEPGTGMPVDDFPATDGSAIWSLSSGAGSDGRQLLIVGSGSGDIHCWDPAVIAPFRPAIRGHSGQVWALCTYYDAAQRPVLASGGTDGTIRLWDIDTMAPVGAPLTGHAGTVVSLTSVTGSDGDVLLASGGVDGTIRIWDLATERHQVRQIIQAHTGQVRGLCALTRDDGRQVIGSVGTDSTIRVWDPVSGELTVTPGAGHVGSIWGVCTVKGTDRELIASAGTDGTVRLWDPSSGAHLLSPLIGHTGQVRAVTPAVDGETGRGAIWSVGTDGSARGWDVESGAALGRPQAFSPDSVERVVRFGPEGAVTAFTLMQDGSIGEWSPRSGRFSEIIGDVRARLLALHTILDSHYLVAVRISGEVVALPVEENTSTITSDYLSISASALESIPGTDLVVLCAGVSVVLWDVVQNRVESEWIRGSLSLVRSVAVGLSASHQPVLILGEDSGSIEVRRVGDYELALRVDHAHSSRIWSICASGARRDVRGEVVFASGGADGAVRVWDLDSGQLRWDSSHAHHGPVYAVSLLDDESVPQLLVSGGSDGVVKIWLITTGRLLKAISLGIPIHCIAQGDMRAESGFREIELMVGTSDGMLSMRVRIDEAR